MYMSRVRDGKPLTYLTPLYDVRLIIRWTTGSHLVFLLSPQQKQQIKEKLVELEADARSVTDRWGYFQRQLLPKALVYGFHLIDAIMVPVAVTMELVAVEWSVFTAVNIYNFIVVALYGMITLGEVWMNLYVSTILTLCPAAHKALKRIHYCFVYPITY